MPSKLLRVSKALICIAFWVELVPFGCHPGPSGTLFVTFQNFVRFCWMALALQPNCIFRGLGSARSSNFPCTFQLRISDLVFRRVYATFCGLGIPKSAQVLFQSQHRSHKSHKNDIPGTQNGQGATLKGPGYHTFTTNVQN